MYFVSHFQSIAQKHTVNHSQEFQEHVILNQNMLITSNNVRKKHHINYRRKLFLKLYRLWILTYQELIFEPYYVLKYNLQVWWSKYENNICQSRSQGSTLGVRGVGVETNPAARVQFPEQTFQTCMQ